MYSVITKVAPATDNERKELKHIACIVIYGELVRYLNFMNANKSNAA